jgi:hypothetical protein
MSSLTKLEYLDLFYNQLTGPIPDLRGLTNLSLLSLGANQLTGEIPAWLNNLTNLNYLFLPQNELSGPIPELSNLTNLGVLGLGANHLTGSIPAYMGTFTNLWYLTLDTNKLNGPIPASLGNLVNLTDLNLSRNALEGEIPTTIINLTNLKHLDLSLNVLTTYDAGVIDFLEVEDPDWKHTQTTPPEGIAIGAVGTDSIEVTWAPIPYADGNGHYEVGYSETAGGPYTSGCTTADKTISACSVSGLEAQTDYHFVVRTFTPQHDVQQNDLLSWYSNEVSATTNSTQLLEPTDLTAVAVSHTQIDLVWTDNSNNEDQFVIDRASEGTENWAQIGTVGTDVTTYGDTTAGCGSTYRYRVYATNAGGASDYSNVAEATTPACPVDVPTLLLPVDGAITDTNTPTFFWTAVSGGHAYRIQIDDSPDFSTPVEDALVYRTYHTSSPLASGITYSWRVRVENSGSDVGEWSDVWTVTVDTTVLPAPILRTPKDGSRTPDTTPRFRWRSVKNAAQYRLQIADNWTFATPVVDLPLSSTAYTLPDTDSLAYGQYFWRAQALNSLGSDANEARCQDQI